MVLDFTDIKRVVSTWIDDNLDHRMILHRMIPPCRTLQKLGEPCILVDRNPTAENIAKLIYEFAAEKGYPVCTRRSCGKREVVTPAYGVVP